MKIEDIKVGMKVTMCVPEGEGCYYGRANIPTGEVGIVQSLYQEANLVMVLYPNWVQPEHSCGQWHLYAWKGKDYEFAGDPDWWDVWMGGELE